jgi:hypothetical protein
VEAMNEGRGVVSGCGNVAIPLVSAPIQSVFSSCRHHADK